MAKISTTVKVDPGARSKVIATLERQFFEQLNDTDIMEYLERKYPHKIVTDPSGRVDEGATMIALGAHKVIVDIRKRIKNGSLAR